MKANERIENFVLDTLQQVWTQMRVDTLPITIFRGSENVSSKEIRDLVVTRVVIFRRKLGKCLIKDYPLYSSSRYDFYLFLGSHMRGYFPYPGMNIFDKLLMLCAVIAMMGFVSTKFKTSVYQFFCPFSLGMYFEKEWMEEFNAAGGWRQLNKYAETSNHCSEFGVEPVSTADLSDLENAKMWLSVMRKDYFLDDIMETFKQRVKARRGDGPPCCSKCFPLYDVLHSLSYPSDVRVDDFQLVEGYLQIFMRMVKKSKIKELEDWFMSDCAETDETGDDFIELLRGQINVVVNILFRENIFDSWNHDSSEAGESNSELCIFCGENRSGRSVACLTSITHRTVSEVSSSTKMDSDKESEEANSKQASN